MKVKTSANIIVKSKEYTITKDYKNLLKKGQKVMISESTANAFKAKGLISSGKKESTKD